MIHEVRKVAVVCGNVASKSGCEFYHLEELISFSPNYCSRNIMSIVKNFVRGLGRRYFRKACDAINEIFVNPERKSIFLLT